jgi:hypothetical protein
MVGTIPQLNDGRLEQIVKHAQDPRERRRAREELQKRQRRRRRFVRTLDDDELKEIVSGPRWIMGEYDTRALESGVNVDGPTLESLAQEEIERRKQEQQAEQQQPVDNFEPVRVVPR